MLLKGRKFHFNRKVFSNGRQYTIYLHHCIIFENVILPRPAQQNLIVKFTFDDCLDCWLKFSLQCQAKGLYQRSAQPIAVFCFARQTFAKSNIVERLHQNVLYSNTRKIWEEKILFEYYFLAVQGHINFELEIFYGDKIDDIFH